jgi:HK97 gp10 family phage protein
MGMNIKLTGFRELEKALSDLPKRTSKPLLTKIATDALEPMRAKAESFAPDDSGDLKRSIIISDKRTRRVRKGAGPKKGITIAMGPASGEGVLNYAALQEFGTVNAPPHAFMRPAWDGEAEGALEHIKENLGREIAAATKRRRKK